MFFEVLKKIKNSIFHNILIKTFDKNKVFLAQNVGWQEYNLNKF